MVRAKRLTGSGRPGGVHAVSIGFRFRGYSWDSSRAQGQPFPSRPLLLRQCLVLGLLVPLFVSAPRTNSDTHSPGPRQDPDPGAPRTGLVGSPCPSP